MNISTSQSYKISFCTTCMNRLHHLKETLPFNLINNSTYENVEFVVLNYNSKDEIDQWMEKEMMAEIKSHKVRYIKTLEPLHFKMSHAKNMVTKFASGDIVCNIDADNFTGWGFASYLNDQFNKNNNIYMKGLEGDAEGRACLWKSDFLKLRGYDEKILDWGYEDTDFYYRMRDQIKRSEVNITDSKYLNTIKHNELERMKNGLYNSEIEFGLVMETNGVIKAYILKKGNQFEYLTIILDLKHRTSFDGGMINKNETRYGEWSLKEGSIEFRDNETKNITILPTYDGGQTYSAPEGIYQKAPKTQVCFYYSAFKGRLVFQENINFKNEVNVNGFGEGLIFEPLL